MNVKNRRCFSETMYLSFQITFAHMAFLFAAFSAFSAIFMVSFRATDEIKHSTLNTFNVKKKEGYGALSNVKEATEKSPLA